MKERKGWRVVLAGTILSTTMFASGCARSNDTEIKSAQPGEAVAAAAVDGEVRGELVAQRDTDCWQCPGGDGDRSSFEKLYVCATQRNNGKIHQGDRVVLTNTGLGSWLNIDKYLRVKTTDDNICWVNRKDFSKRKK